MPVGVTSTGGAPWRTQERPGQIVATQYRPTPDGLAGNDDLGQMSAWLVFTALGFDPVAPGSNRYVIGRPFVDRPVLNLPDGRRLVIVADGLTAAARYVIAVTLNGVALDRAYLTDAELRAGGELRITMSATPNRHRGTGRTARSYAMSTTQGE